MDIYVCVWGGWVHTLKMKSLHTWILATDDILHMYISEGQLNQVVLNRFGDFFFLRLKEEQQSNSFIIIKSENGISIYQTNHIIKSILE